MPANVSGQMLINLGVSGHRLAFAGDGIPVNVVARTGTKQATAVLLQFAHQLSPLHTAISLMACLAGTSSKTISL